MRARATAICLLALALPAASDAADFPDPALAAELDSRGTLSRAVPPGRQPEWIPDVSARDSILAEIAGVRPTTMAEVLRLLRGSAARLDEPDGRLAVYNMLHSVSTMEGITYWSASHGRERVLFTTSYAVRGPGETGRQPDPVFDAIPRIDQMYSLQVDQSFGRHLYRSTYTDAGDCFVVKTENADTIAWLFIPVATPGNLVTISVIAPTAQGLLLAGISWMKASVPLPFRANREASLVNRLVAMTNWLAGRLGGR